MKKCISYILSLVCILSLVACSDQNVEPTKTTPTTITPTDVPAITEAPISSSLPEVDEAHNMGIVSDALLSDLTNSADFPSFYDMVSQFISIVDENALAKWTEKVDRSGFPSRSMRRDDALVLIMEAADALGWTTYNAREYAFCIENEVNYDLIFSQLSWDYPYLTDADRQVSLLFSDGSQDPVGNVASTAVYYMQRRMDLSQRTHFLTCDENMDFHLNAELTKEDAIAAIMRLYHSEILGINLMQRRVPTEEDEALLKQADDLKLRILNNQDSLACTGTAYYISSSSGDDTADGKSPETAWATLDKVNTAPLKEGDGVYFKRGDLWRGQLWAQKGVVYSAYGEGDKPKLYASSCNGADPSKWALVDGTNNIWRFSEKLMHCGNIIFNEGESYAHGIYPAYLNGYVSTVNPGQPFDLVQELSRDLDFFSAADSILYDGAPFRYTVMDTSDYNERPEVVGDLYLRCDKGNPGEVYQSIEFAERQNIIIPADDTVFNNLCIKYCGSHAIFGGDMGFDVSFCEIGWIGGSIQYYSYDTGEAALYGNGVECDGSYDHYSVTDCYIYQCFDAGVSNQDPQEDVSVTGNDNIGYHDVLQQNVTYARNLFAYISMPIEIFFTLEDNAGFGTHRMENTLIEDNYFLYTGYGFTSTVMPDWSKFSSAYEGHRHPNTAKNFVMRNNVFYLSTGPLITSGAKAEFLPLLEGNTYVQTNGGWLAYWTPQGETEGRYIAYKQATIADIIVNELGDKKGVSFVK